MSNKQENSIKMVPTGDYWADMECMPADTDFSDIVLNFILGVRGGYPFANEMNKLHGAFQAIWKQLEPTLVAVDMSQPMLMFQALVPHFAARTKWCCERLFMDDDEAIAITKFIALVEAKEISKLRAFPNGINQKDLKKEVLAVILRDKYYSTPPQVAKTYPLTPMHNTPQVPAPVITLEAALDPTNMVAKMFIPHFNPRSGIIDDNERRNAKKYVNDAKLEGGVYQGTKDSRSIRKVLTQLKARAEADDMNCVEYHFLLNNHLAERVREMLPDSRRNTFEELEEQLNQRVTKLIHRFGRNQESEKIIVRRIYSTLRQKTDEKIQDYCSRFDEALLECRSLGILIQESEIPLQFIEGLTSTLQEAAFNIYDSNITYHELMDKLITRSMMRKPTQQASSSHHVGASLSSQPKQPEKEQDKDQSKKHKDVDCRICGGKHYANSCSISPDDRNCTFCKAIGHVENGCWKKKKTQKDQNLNTSSMSKPVHQKEAQVVEVQILSVECEEMDEPPMLTCSIGDCNDLRVLLDTGASCSIISRSMLDRLDPQQKYPRSFAIHTRVTYADQSSELSSTSTNLPVRYSDNGEERTTTITFLVLESVQRSILLGRPALHQIGVRLTFGQPKKHSFAEKPLQISAQICNLTHESDAFVPEPDEFSSVYSTLTLENTSLERTTQAELDRNQRDFRTEGLSEDDLIRESALHFLQLTEHLSWQEFADGYFIKLRMVTAEERDMKEQIYAFELQWKLLPADTNKRSWNSQDLINKLTHEHKIEWNGHVEGFTKRRWWNRAQWSPGVSATIFPVVQKDTKTTTCRPCADMRIINALSPKVSAATYSVSEAVLKLRSYLRPGDCQVGQFDLSKAFYRIRVSVLDDQGLNFPLRLQVGSTSYTSDRMVFGLSVGPSGLNASTHLQALIVNKIWKILQPDHAPPHTVVVMDDFLFIGTQASITLYAKIYHTVWGLTGFESPPDKQSIWNTNEKSLWLGQLWTFNPQMEKLLLFRGLIKMEKPMKWTKRAAFRIAGKFVGITHGFHESLARVHADAIRQISGSWDGWDTPYIDKQLTSDLERHMQLALDCWQSCTAEDQALSLLYNVVDIQVHTDASQRGYGFTVKHDENFIYTEAKLFASSTVSWHANRREYYGVSQAVVRLDGLLRFLPALKSIRLYTDSKVTVANTDQWKNISSKALERKVIMRMRNTILEISYFWKTMGIHFRILHIPGADNAYADRLSRTAILSQSVHLVDIQNRFSPLLSLPSFKSWLVTHDFLHIWRHGTSKVNLHEDPGILMKSFIFSKQSTDDTCKRIRSELENLQKTHANSQTQGELRFLMLETDGIIVRLQSTDKQVWIPDSILDDTLTHIHDQLGHAALGPVLSNFFRHCFHPQARKTCRKIIRTCESCNLASSKTSGQTSYGPVKMPSRPFETVGIDLYGPLQRASGETTKNSKKFILTICDRLTGYTRFVLLENSRAETIVDSFEEFCWEIGTGISNLVTDNGPQFVLSPLLKGLCLLWGIRHITLPPYTPSVGGFYEIRHRIATRCIRTLLIQYPIARWRILIAIAQAKVNSHIGMDRSSSPHQLIYGWTYSHPVMNAFSKATMDNPPIDWNDPFSSPEDEAHTRGTARDEFLRIWQEEFLARQQVQADNFDKNNTGKTVYIIGDYVYFVNELIRRKFSPQSAGPFRLIDQVGNHQWLVKSDDSAIPIRVHTSKLRLADQKGTTEDTNLKPPADTIPDTDVSNILPSGNDTIRKRPSNDKQSPGISKKKSEQEILAQVNGSTSIHGRLRRGSLIGNTK